MSTPPYSDPLSYQMIIQWRNQYITLITEQEIGKFTGPTNNNWIQTKQVVTAPANSAKATIVIRVSSFQSTMYSDHFTVRPL